MEITILGVTTLELLLLFYYFRGESIVPLPHMPNLDNNFPYYLKKGFKNYYTALTMKIQAIERA